LVATIPKGVRESLDEVLVPQLLALLQNNIKPIYSTLESNQQLQIQQHEGIISKIHDQSITVQTLATMVNEKLHLSEGKNQKLLTKVEKLDSTLNLAMENVKSHITNATETLKRSRFGEEPISRRGSSSSPALNSFHESLHELEMLPKSPKSKDLLKEM
jgi:hypothetical protein